AVDEDREAGVAGGAGGGPAFGGGGGDGDGAVDGVVGGARDERDGGVLPGEYVSGVSHQRLSDVQVGEIELRRRGGTAEAICRLTVDTPRGWETNLTLIKSLSGLHFGNVRFPNIRTP